MWKNPQIDSVFAELVFQPSLFRRFVTWLVSYLAAGGTAEALCKSAIYRMPEQTV